MDPAGCSEGLVTDSVFMPRDEPNACTVTIASFWVGTSLLLFFRLLSCVVRIISRRNRRRRRQDAKPTPTFSHSKWSMLNALPLGSLIDVSTILLYLILYVLAGTNVVNYENGWALALYSMSYLPFALGFTIFLFRTVRLGSKIVPLKGDMAHRDDLRTFNGLGKFLVTLQLASLLASSLILIVFGPIFPQHEAIFSSLGFASKAMFMICTGLGIINQIERCVRAITNVTKNAGSSIDTSNLANVALAITRLRYNQLLVVLIDLPIAVVLALIACNVLQLTWVLAILIVQGSEILGSLAVLVPFFMKKKSSSSQSNATSNVNNININYNLAAYNINDKLDSSQQHISTPSLFPVKTSSTVEPSSQQNEEQHLDPVLSSTVQTGMEIHPEPDHHQDV